ncbi:MAG: hypothetical protein ACTHOO_05175 [Alcanivorax sp.]
MNYAYDTTNQKQAIIGTIMGLMSELKNLAPHPDRPNYHGPLFLNANPNFKTASDNDGMLGSMLLESMMGTAVTEALSETLSEDMSAWAESIDVSNIMDLYSEYITDIERNTQKAAAHGQGTMARMSGTSISGGFNLRSNITEGMQAFFDDLPKRMTIERNMAYYAKQLDNLNAAPQYQHQYAAPRPRFAA